MNYRLTILGILLSLIVSASAWAHCEVPCGIYDDEARFTELEEHITTIEKAMAQVTELSAAAEENYNQIVRWVTNKEKHAEKFQHIVTQYFLTRCLRSLCGADDQLPADAGDGDEMQADHRSGECRQAARTDCQGANALLPIEPRARSS